MAVLSLAQQLFPPPQLMSFPCVGVDISDTSLKYIQFVRKHTSDKNLSIKYWGDIEIPINVVERGNVHDVEKLAEALKEMRERTHAQYVNISLPEERAYLFETTIARNTPQKDVRGLLEFRLEENVPLSPRDAYFDYAFVGEDTENKMTRVVVAVYAQSTINSYYEACKKADLIPLAFEIEAQAIARASVPWTHEDTCMIVDFGKSRMGVGIVHDGMLMYTSTVEVAGSQLSQDMRTVLGDITEAEITHVKNTQGLMHTKTNAAVATILEKCIENVADELGIRIHYWNTRGIDRDVREIKKIIVCGGSSNLFGLPEFLNEKLGIPVERAHVWANALTIEENVPPIPRRYSYGYATAIGLALRNFSKI